jgi:hypothetical protein
VQAGYQLIMPRDRDQLTPDEPKDAEKLDRDRGQGTGSSGQDVLPDDRSSPGASSTD